MAALPDVSGLAGAPLPPREVRTKPTPNPIHHGDHDACFPCTKCKHALRDLESRLSRMSTRMRASVVRELLTDRGMRVSSFHFDRLVPKILGNTDLPAGLDRKKMKTADFRGNLPVIMRALDPSLDDGDDMPALRGRDDRVPRRTRGEKRRTDRLPVSGQDRAPLRVTT